MNILLSSYSINPYKGSEDAVGWNWLLQVAKHYNKPNDKVYVITKKFNEKDTIKGIKEYELDNVKLIIVDVPNCLNWFREKHSMFHHMYYMLWQNEAYKWAKNSKIKFDIIHHVTMGDFRITGKMYKFKDSYTIFGPVGGGQVTPKSLKCYESNKFYEKFRQIVNNATMFLPSYGKNIKRFNAVYAVNAETAEILQKSSGRKIELLTDVALTDNLKNLHINKRQDNSIPRIIFVGRLIEKKGIIFLLDIIKALPFDLPFALEIYGNGPLKGQIKTQIIQNNLSDKVCLKGTLPYAEIYSVYKSADIFVLPSLRETGGTVLTEAMAHKLPICSLDMSISKTLSKNKCGLFTNVNQSKEEIINEFANNIAVLIKNPDLRRQLGENGYHYANNELTWDKKFETVYKRNDLI